MYGYQNLAKPIFSQGGSVKSTRKKSLWKRLFCGEAEGVKPITRSRSNVSREQEFYQKYGIIWSGSDESSVIHSIV